MRKNPAVVPALLLVRHAKAEAKHPAGDAARGLTSEGREAFRAEAAALTKICQVSSILTSPLVRSVQTAEIFAAAQGLDRVDIRDELTPRWRAASRILELSLELPPGCALVGHNPSFSEVAAELLGLGELPFKFRKGAALALKRRGRTFSMLWLASP